MNSFKRYTNKDVTAQTAVYTGPASTQVTVIGMTLANTATSPAYVSVLLNDTYLVKNAPVPVGGTLVPVGGDQKVVVEPNDNIYVVSTQTVDSIVSVLEIS